MDIFIEQLVKKNREAKDYLVIVGGIIAALLVVYILGSLMLAVPYVGFVIFIVVCGRRSRLYNRLSSGQWVSEKGWTVGVGVVDAIINLKKRKRLTELNAREIELMGTRSNPNFERYLNNPAYKKVYACIDKNREDLCFVIYNEDGAGKMLLFSPNEEIRNGFKKYNTQKVELD